MTRTELHKAPTAECKVADPDPRRKRLARVLARGEEKVVKRRRDNVVHAYWWTLDGCGVLRSRFYRRKDGALMRSSLEELGEDAELLFEYALRLDDLLGEEWPRALLSAGEASRGDDQARAASAQEPDCCAADVPTGSEVAGSESATAYPVRSRAAKHLPARAHIG